MTTNPQDVRSALPHRSKLDKSLDKGFVSLTRVFALAVAAVLLTIAVQVAVQALPAIQEFGANFISQSSWNPVRESYGALPVIYGTLVSSFIGLLIAVPIGVGTAILLSENLLPVSIRTVLVFLVELLAAIPSVVYGIWGIFVLIPFLGDLAGTINQYFGWLPIFGTPSSGTLEGPGMLPAGIILAIMTLPIITAISRDALISVPRNLREAAVGLGATRWETILKVLVPAAFSGIVSAVMLALGRAMGETMAVTMIIGNSNKIEASLFAPANTISSLLANQFAEADGIQIAALMYAALILFFLTLIVNVLAELVVLRVKKL
ncbi:phosphate ABC transporter permease subunit PstC [Mastigocoleus testarum]|uniref:Phosphate transport system permease protein n=1 Tax=Mastigocoleus testarum BC008 TaxID=371196 RepID=A0A0V7ZTV7_9CYAN|nr:phosphate ABC transporter permease subunit PstC [Mastigocoleus testarum]KST67583.1 phosphate ABC transporter permease [Mastigocoleus testarum BC008]KST69781.1 phosphate ABC transporter permease [Mastigocoleus testarum BC008]